MVRRTFNSYIVSNFMGMVCGLAPILGLASTQSPTLVNFKTGVQVSRDQLLSTGQLLVYIEKDCSTCSSYIQNISSCDESVKKAIQLVSMNTPAQTKTYIRSLAKDFGVYVAKNPSELKNIHATPTTQGISVTKIGHLSCDEIGKIQGL